MLEKTPTFLVAIFSIVLLAVRESAGIKKGVVVDLDTSGDESDDDEVEGNLDPDTSDEYAKFGPLEQFAIENIRVRDEKGDDVTEEKFVMEEDVLQNDSYYKNKKKEYVQKLRIDSHEMLKKFEENYDTLWKDKYKPEKRKETGFDLTTEEIKKFKIWDNGVIPYYIDVVSFSDKALREKIRSYLQMVNFAAGIQFVELPGPPADDQKRWVLFINRRSLLGCADHTVRNFTTRGVQQVVLGYDCIHSKGELAEAVMSIVGVPAQHNAPDRDTYIQINLENILPDKKYLFEKLNDGEWLFHDLEYDFNSITHYDLFKHSVNGRSTIQLKDDSKDLGLSKELSANDILKIKMLYSYIAKNMKLPTQECERLFKSRHKFERFVSHTTNVKPREKPSRYLNKAN